MSKSGKPKNIKNIVVIDLAFIGDVILATPVLRALKEAWPRAEITMLTVPLTAEVAAMNPYVDAVLTYDKRGEQKGFSGMFKAAKVLRKRKFDLAVCMNFAVRGAVVAWLARIPNRLGYDAQHAGLFLTTAASSQRIRLQHEALNHLEVLKPWGLGTADTSLALRPSPEVLQSLADKRQALSLADADYIVFCPFGNNSRREMALETIRETAAALAKQQVVYLIGGPKEAEKLQAAVQGLAAVRVRVLAGDLTLPELAAFVQRADCMVTVDSGPLHIAQAVQCPTVALFGPALPEIWGPRGAQDIVLYKKRSCSPCDNTGNCQGKPCIQDITAEEIRMAVQQVLAANQKI